MSDTPRTDAECMSGETRFTDMVHYTFAQQLERELADVNADYMCLARELDGHDATECLMNLNQLKADLADALEQRDRLAEALQIADEAITANSFSANGHARSKIRAALESITNTTTSDTPDINSIADQFIRQVMKYYEGYSEDELWEVFTRGPFAGMSERELYLVVRHWDDNRKVLRLEPNADK